MIRCLVGLLGVVCIGAGEVDCSGIRAAAEAQLVEARLGIAQQQAALLGRLQSAVTAGTAARERLVRAAGEADAARIALTQRQQDHDRSGLLVRQLTDRAVVAARLGEREQRELAAKPPAERVAAALAGLDRRLAALPARLARSVADEAVVGRRGVVASVPVLRLGEAQAVAMGAEEDYRGLLERAADGSSWLVVGPDPGPVAQGVIPFDASGNAAHQHAAVTRSFGEWLSAGRAFIWPILAVLALGLGLVIERSIALARRRVDPLRLVAVADHLAYDDVAAAGVLVAAGATPLDRVLRAGIGAVGRPREAREAVVEQVLLAETAQLNRGLPAIAVLAGVAPLLGLLGTVTGMIDMFSVIAAQGSGNAKSLSGGISEALICTQAGMLVAIPLLLAHAWLGRLAERRCHLLEEAACGVLGLVERKP